MTTPLAITRLDPAGYRRTPWKNGGGMTVDIADCYRPGAEPGGWTGVIWRLGRTRIETPAPFSDLAGLDRILTVIGGRGLTLRSADGQAFDAREPLRPVRFPGDLAIVSELEDGPVAVLNLMAARGEVAIDVQVLNGGGRASFPPGTLVAYAPDGAAALTVGGEPVALAPDEAVRTESNVALNTAVSAGIVALAWIGRNHDV